MNYFALLGAILAGLTALYCLSHIVRVALGNGRWHSSWGFLLNAVPAAVCGTLAVWLGSAVVA